MIEGQGHCVISSSDPDIGDRFNWAARKLHKRLEQLGAVEFYPRGEADEQDSDG